VQPPVLSLSVRQVLVLVLEEKSWSWSLALKSLLTSLSSHAYSQCASMWRRARPCASIRVHALQCAPMRLLVQLVRVGVNFSVCKPGLEWKLAVPGLELIPMVSRAGYYD